MNIKQASEYEASILAAAKDWVEGTAILGQEEIAIVAEYYGVPLPKCFENFISADSPTTFRAYSAHKTIGKTLERLAGIIRKEEN